MLWDLGQTRDSQDVRIQDITAQGPINANTYLAPPSRSVSFDVTLAVGGFTLDQLFPNSLVATVNCVLYESLSQFPSLWFLPYKLGGVKS